MFPPEIWLVILKKIDDPVDLIRLKSVSHEWNEMIKEIFPGRNQQWADELKKKAPLLFLKKEYKASHSCKSYYMVWRKWHMTPYSLSKPLMYPDNLLKFAENEKITCIESHDDILAIGSTAGVVYFCKYSNARRPFFIGVHGETVNKIHFWTGKRDVLTKKKNILDFAVSSSANGVLKYWLYIRKKEVPSDGLSGDIFQRRIVQGKTLSSYNGNGSRVELDDTTDLPLDDDEQVVAGSQNILLTSNGSKIRRWYHLSEDPNICPQYINMPDCISSVERKKFYLIGHLTFCCADNILAVMNKSWEVYDMTTTFGSKVTCVHVYMGIDDIDRRRYIFIGLESGAVYVYEFGELQRKTHFHPEKFKDILKFTDKPIIYVSYFYDGDSIIVGTESNIYYKEVQLRPRPLPRIPINKNYWENKKFFPFKY